MSARSRSAPWFRSATDDAAARRERRAGIYRLADDQLVWVTVGPLPPMPDVLPEPAPPRDSCNCRCYACWRHREGRS
jgi:hypothetical protein